MPVLAVNDVAAAVDFYRSIGFSLNGMWPGMDAPTFAILGWGGVTLALDGNEAPTEPRRGWQAYIYVEDVLALLARLQDAGIEVERGPDDAFYGCREIDLRDPDGNLICFATDLMPGPEGPGL